MSRVLDGIGASEGIGAGRVHILNWGVPEVPHRSIDSDEVQAEVEHLQEVFEWAKKRLLDIEDSTEERLGAIEARIFEPQLLMLEDPELIEGAALYIRENRLSAARALDWRLLEIQARWSRTAHPMVLDRLNDLQDLQVRLLHQLLGLPDPTDVSSLGENVIIVTRNLTPSLTVQFDPKLVLGIAADHGTRTAHWVMLARSLGIPTVCGMGVVSEQARAGQEAIVDGRIGRVVLDPDAHDRSVFRERETQILAWEEELENIAQLPSITADEQPVELRANLDMPAEAEKARLHGAQGVGLFRTEFLVVGRTQMPGEEDQYLAYRKRRRGVPQTGGHGAHVRSRRRQIPDVSAHAGGGESVPRLACDPCLPGRTGVVPHPAPSHPPSLRAW